MLIELAEFNEKLQEYRKILVRLRDEQDTYRRKRERLSKLSQRRRSEVRKSDVGCHVCNTSIDTDDTNSFATCRGCERLVCRSEENKCCEWIPAIGIWECQNCHSNRAIQQKAGEWLLNQLTIRLQNPGPVNLKNDTLFGLNVADPEDGRSSSASISSNQKVKVREFIEELLSSMLNGPLDDISVGQLLKNENYLPLCEEQKVPDSPSDQHFELRKLLQRILDEVAKLPEMLNHSGLPLRPEEHLPYFSPKKYEQLLATAVLNKVVEDYRNPKNFEDAGKQPKEAVPPTTDAAGSAPISGATFDINHNKVPGVNSLNEISLRQMSFDKEELQSKEDLYQRSLSESDESYLSDYIQKHTVPLPDLSDTPGSGSGPEDDLISLKSNTTDGTWEENWLFKKRQLKAMDSAIAMLVPSPTEEVKALIGDQNVDDVSDLSEADAEDYDSDSNNKDVSATNSARHTEDSLEDPIQDSLISVNSIPSNEPTLSEAKNSLLLADAAQVSTIPDTLLGDLISIEPTAEKVEASNPALLRDEVNYTQETSGLLLANEKTTTEAVETDDVKLLLQDAPKQRDNDGNVLYPIGIARAINTDSQIAEYDRKEVPIDRGETEHALLTISTPAICVSINDRTNNLTSTTNNLPELQQQPTTFISETGIILVETDPSVPSQLLAQPEPETLSASTNGLESNINAADDALADEKLIPGSIAERDILKYRNATPIANNPYSPDVLQKRLSESSRKSNLADFDRLTNKDTDAPTEGQPTTVRKNQESTEQEISSREGLQTQHQRYGRDYYINDAKLTAAPQKHNLEIATPVSHSTDDEKSLLLSQKQDSSDSSQKNSPAVSPSHKNNSQHSSLQTGVFPFVKSSSCGNVIPSNKTEDIFSAGRPVQVDPTDPILKKGTKLEYLSTPAHEVYLIPANEPINLQSLESSSEQSTISRADESLTYSEDSDVTRIYEIGTGETKLVQGDAIQGVRAPTTTPPPTPVDETVSCSNEIQSIDSHTVSKAEPEVDIISEEILEIIPQTSKPPPCVVDPVPQDFSPPSPTIDRSHLSKPRYVQVKQLSPETIRFFTPKKPFTSSTSNLSSSASLSLSSTEIRDLPSHPIHHMHSSLHIDFPASRNVPSHEFIIEKEVMDVLPSVKELAKCYSGSHQEINAVSRPILKPTVKLRKDFIRQSSEMLHDEQVQETRSGMPQVPNKNRRMYSSTSSINAAEEIREIRRLNLEAYNRPTFVPMAPGHSITARSLSKQIREELKTNATDDHKVHSGHISPERPSSPVFAPGHLRSSIQFFESLKDK